MGQRLRVRARGAGPRARAVARGVDGGEGIRRFHAPARLRPRLARRCPAIRGADAPLPGLRRAGGEPRAVSRARSGVVAGRVAGLAGEIVRWAEQREDVTLVTPRDPARRAGIVAVAPRDPAAVSKRLTAHKVSHSLREGAIRLSPHVYNTSAEVGRALEVLESRTP